jgi:hypothetical protein
MSTEKNIPATPATDAEASALISSFSEPAPIEESLAEKIVRLESQLAEARTGNLKKPIEQPDGTTRSFEDIHAENQKLMEQWALEVESSRRLREEIAARNPVAYATPMGQVEWRPQTFAERPLMDEDAAIKEFGLAKWAALTPKQKAQARTVTKSDVDRVNLSEVFGRTSSGRKAMALSSENPALYRMCKRKAKDEGLL